MKRFVLAVLLFLVPWSAFAQSYPHEPQSEGLNVTGANAGAIHGGAVNNLFAAPPTIGGGLFFGSTYGVSSTNADNAAFINAAEADAYAAGGGEVFLPVGVIKSGQISKLSKVHLKGFARDSTVIKLINGANTDLVLGLGSNALWGTNSTGGTTNWEISDLTLDGNMANNTSGSCLAVYAYKYRLTNIKIQNCANYGWRSEWSSVGTVAPDAEVSDVFIQTTGWDGHSFNGPSDSNIHDLVIADAGTATSHTYAGLHIVGSGARWSGVHVYHISATNLMKYCLNDSGAGSQFENSHFEGCDIPGYLNGPSSQYADTVLFFNTLTGPDVIINQPIVFKGTIIAGPFDVVHTGIVIGDGTGNAGSYVIDSQVFGNMTNIADFTHDLGNGKARITAFCFSTTCNVAGTPAWSDQIEIQAVGSVGASPYLFQFPTLALPAMPTSCTGKPAGTLWNSSGTVHVC